MRRVATCIETVLFEAPDVLLLALSVLTELVPQGMQCALCFLVSGLTSGGAPPPADDENRVDFVQCSGFVLLTRLLRMYLKALRLAESGDDAAQLRAVVAAVVSTLAATTRENACSCPPARATRHFSAPILQRAWCGKSSTPANAWTRCWSVARSECARHWRATDSFTLYVITTGRSCEARQISLGARCRGWRSGTLWLWPTRRDEDACEWRCPAWCRATPPCSRRSSGARELATLVTRRRPARHDATARSCAAARACVTAAECKRAAPACPAVVRRPAPLRRLQAACRAINGGDTRNNQTFVKGHRRDFVPRRAAPVPHRRIVGAAQVDQIVALVRVDVALRHFAIEAIHVAGRLAHAVRKRRKRLRQQALHSVSAVRLAGAARHAP